jgi:hypothetical protein
MSLRLQGAELSRDAYQFTKSTLFLTERIQSVLTCSRKVDDGECAAIHFAHGFCAEVAGADGGWAAGIADIAFPAIGKDRPKFHLCDNRKNPGRTDADVAPRPWFGGE